MPTKISPESVIKLLNEFVALDPKAMQELLAVRIDCSSNLAKHPEFQGAKKPKNLNQNQIFFLGIMNSLFGVLQEGPLQSYGPISAVYNRDGKLTGFSSTDRESPAFQQGDMTRIEMSCHQI